MTQLSSYHIFTHAGCLDGSASAILFRHAGGDPKNIHWVPAGRVDAILGDSVVTNILRVPLLFVDISPHEESTARWMAGRGNVTMIDHHASAARWAGMSPDFLIDTKNEACGCELFRMWLAREVDPKFDGAPFKRMCRIVDDHDRWQLKIPFSQQLPRFLSLVGQKDFVERFMDVETRFAEERPDYWNDFERDVVRLLERVQAQRFRGLLQKFQVREKDWEGRRVRIAYLISAELNNSELLNMYLKEHPDVDAACQLNFDLQKVAYRSDGKIDLSRYCAQRGGGGHANAAGHPFPDGILLGVIERIHGG